jgi:hypothetical protein
MERSTNAFNVGPAPLLEGVVNGQRVIVNETVRPS